MMKKRSQRGEALRPHDSGSQSNETVVLRFDLAEQPRLALGTSLAHGKRRGSA